MAKAKTVHSSFVVGGVDTHKDLHVAAVVDQNNRILEKGRQAETQVNFLPGSQA